MVSSYLSLLSLTSDRINQTAHRATFEANYALNSGKLQSYADLLKFEHLSTLPILGRLILVWIIRLACFMASLKWHCRIWNILEVRKLSTPSRWEINSIYGSLPAIDSRFLLRRIVYVGIFGRFRRVTDCCVAIYNKYKSISTGVLYCWIKTFIMNRSWYSNLSRIFY